MHRTFWRLVAVIVVILGLSAAAQPVFTGDLPAVGSASQSLISHFSTVEGGPTTVILIDPQKKVMSVYQVGRENGQIQFKSQRPMQWDMEMDGHNTGDLSPKDIRTRLEQLR